MQLCGFNSATSLAFAPVGATRSSLCILDLRGAGRGTGCQTAGAGTRVRAGVRWGIFLSTNCVRSDGELCHALEGRSCRCASSTPHAVRRNNLS